MTSRADQVQVPDAARGLVLEWTRHIPTYLVAQVGPIVVGLIGLALLPRLLGPEAYGLYAVALASATTTAAWFGDWFIPAGIRLAAEAGSHARQLWAALGRLSVLAGLLAGVVAATLAVPLTGAVVALPVCALAIAMVMSKPLAALLRAEMRTGLYAAWSLASSAVGLILGIALFVQWREPAALLAAAIISPLVASVWFAHRSGWPWLSGTTVNAWRTPAIRFGLPIAVTGIGSQFLLLGDRYLLGILSGVESAGLYVAAYNIAEKMVALPFAILFAALYPVGAAAWARRDTAHAMHLLYFTNRTYGALAGGIVVFQAACGAWVVTLIAGDAFEPPGLVPVLVTAGTWLWFTGILQHQPLEWEKRSSVITALTLLAATLNLSINFVLIPKFGELGAAAATLIAYAAYLLVTTLVVTKRGLAPRIWSAHLMVATGGVAALAHALWKGHADPLHGAIVTIGYLALLWMLRQWTFENVALLVGRTVPASTQR